jgi:hypothetical protein
MTVRIYRSTDGSAPVLTGQAGKLTDLLDAILVNGYGSKTAAGWTINQTTTNKRGYLQNTTGANNASGMLLYVDDTASGAGGAKEARACGFETMSAITPTGTGQFPTSSQSALGPGVLIIRKSTTADATARAWTCIANGQTLYLFVETGDQPAPALAAFPFVFGDFFPRKTTDWLNSVNGLLSGVNTSTNLASTITGHFVARTWSGVGGSVAVGKHINMFPFGWGPYNIGAGTLTGYVNGTSASTGGAGASVAIGRNSMAGTFNYPNSPDGALDLSGICIHHNGFKRGYLKGLWSPEHDRPLNHNDTYSITSGNLNGKDMIAQAIPSYIASAQDTAQIHIETSDTWTSP